MTDLALPTYITDNMNIPITEEELQYLNSIIFPQTYAGWYTFTGGRGESILFYSQVDDLNLLAISSGAEWDLDILRSVMKNRGIKPDVHELDTFQLIDIMLARIIVEANSLV